MGEVLDDPYIKNRTDPVTLRRLLDRRDVIDAVGGDAVEELRRQLGALRR